MGGVAPSGVCFPLVLSSAVTSASGFLTLGKGSSLPLQPLVTVMVKTRSKPVLGSVFSRDGFLGPCSDSGERQMQQAS